MFSTTGDVVRQELEFLAASFTARKSKVKDAFTNPTTSDTRCEKIKNALMQVLGGGLKDGSFNEGTGRRDAATTVAGRARTHHAIYLFTPSQGLAQLRGALHEALKKSDLEPGRHEELTKSLKDDAQKLNNAFNKYRILLHWVDTFSVIATTLGDEQEINSGGPASSTVHPVYHRQGQVFSFVHECIKRGQAGAITPFEALLQPSRLMPFSFMMEMCFANGGLIKAEAGVRKHTGSEVASAGGSTNQGTACGDLTTSVIAALDMCPSESTPASKKSAISLRLSPVNTEGLAALRLLQDEAKGTNVQGHSESCVVVAVEEWLQREEVSPAMLISDAAWWCEESDSHAQELQAIPETPSPAKGPNGARHVSSDHKDSEHVSAQPSFADMLQDLAEHNALLLVSVRAKAGAVRQLALVSSIAYNGRIGFLQFVSDAVLRRPPQTAAETGTAVLATADAIGTDPLPVFGSHMLEAWTWTPAKHLNQKLREFAKQSQQDDTAAAAHSSTSLCDTEDQGGFNACGEDDMAWERLLQLAKQHLADFVSPAAVEAAGGEALKMDLNSDGTRGGEPKVAVAASGSDVPDVTLSTAQIGQNIQETSIREVLERLDARYELLLTKYTNQNPLVLFDQIIPECLGLVQKLTDSCTGAENDAAMEAGQDDQVGLTSRTCKNMDARQVVLTHIKGKWIKKTKEWSVWVSSTVSREESRRRHEFQALLRLYVKASVKRATADDAQGQGLTVVLKAMSRFFVNMERPDKLCYIKETLQPLCGAQLPRILDQIADNFGLSAEEDQQGEPYEREADAGVAQPAGSQEGVLGSSETHVLAKRSKEATFSGDDVAHASKRTPVPVHPSKNGAPNSWSDSASSRLRAQTEASAHRLKKIGSKAVPAATGSISKLGKRQASQRLRSRSIKEMKMPRKNSRRGAASISSQNKTKSSSKSGSHASVKRGAGAPNAVLPGTSRIAPRNSPGLRSHGQPSLAASEQRPLNTPMPCKAATVLVPETPKTKITAKIVLDNQAKSVFGCPRGFGCPPRGRPRISGLGIGPAPPDNAQSKGQLKNPLRQSQLSPNDKFDQSPRVAVASFASSTTSIKDGCAASDAPSVKHSQLTPPPPPPPPLQTVEYAKSPGFELDALSPPRKGGLFASLEQPPSAAKANEMNSRPARECKEVDRLRSFELQKGSGSKQLTQEQVTRKKQRQTQMLSIKVEEEDFEANGLIAESSKPPRRQQSAETWGCQHSRVTPVLQQEANVLAGKEPMTDVTRACKAGTELLRDGCNPKRQACAAKEFGVSVPSDAGRDTLEPLGERRWNAPVVAEEAAQIIGQGHELLKYHEYGVGDLVLVSTEHVNRRLGKRSTEVFSKQSMAKVIGPFAVVAVKDCHRSGGGGGGGGEGRRCKLKIPELIRLDDADWVHASALRLWQTQLESLSARRKTSEIKKQQRHLQQGEYTIEHVLDVQLRKLTPDQPPVRCALVCWEGEYPEAEKYTWEPFTRENMRRAAGAGEILEGVSRKHDAVVEFDARQTACENGWVPTFAARVDKSAPAVIGQVKESGEHAEVAASPEARSVTVLAGSTADVPKIEVPISDGAFEQLPLQHSRPARERKDVDRLRSSELHEGGGSKDLSHERQDRKRPTAADDHEHGRSKRMRGVRSSVTAASSVLSLEASDQDNLPGDRARKAGPGSQKGRTDDSGFKRQQEPHERRQGFQEGETVWAWHKASAAFFEASITRKFSQQQGGGYWVTWHDGDTEDRHKKFQHLKRHDTLSSSRGAARMAVGASSRR